LTSIHLVYLRIPGKRINHVLTSIHLVYLRIPGKGITLHRLLRGEQEWDDDDDTSESGIGNVLSRNNHV